MASLAAVAGGALINALALSGTNAAFSLLGDHCGAERERHNLAIEQLSKARVVGGMTVVGALAYKFSK